MIHLHAQITGTTNRAEDLDLHLSSVICPLVTET